MQIFTVSDGRAALVMQDLPDTLDCSIHEATDAITPEEREEVKVSGEYISSVNYHDSRSCDQYYSYEVHFS